MKYEDSKLIITDKHIRWGNHSIMHIEEKKKIQKQAKDIMKLKPKSILELGYGLGLTAEIFKKADRHLVIELHPDIAQIARDKGFDVWEGDVADFETDEEFDVIYNDLYGVNDRINNIKDKVKHNKYITFDI